MHLLVGFEREEEMHNSTLVELNLEEEENDTTTSCPPFSSGIPPRRKTMFSACKVQLIWAVKPQKLLIRTI